MKNIFGIDITENENNKCFDGDVFVSQRLFPELQRKMDSCFGSPDEIKSKSNLYLVIEIIYYLLIIVTIIFVKSDIELLFDYIFKDGISFKTAFNNAPYIFYAEFIVIILFIVISVIKVKANKNLERAIISGVSDDDFENICKEAVIQLNIPDDAVEIDVLGYEYKVKGDKVKHIKKLCSHLNYEMVMYNQKSCLNFAEICEGWVMSIPLSSFVNITKVKKRATIPWWNKNEDYCSPHYKQFKVFKNNYKNVYDNYNVYYYKVEISDIRGEFELLIPNYDIQEFINITGLVIEED